VALQPLLLLRGASSRRRHFEEELWAAAVDVLQVPAEAAGEAWVARQWEVALGAAGAASLQPSCHAVPPEEAVVPEVGEVEPW
jgi:hypothetical protein